MQLAGFSASVSTVCPSGTIGTTPSSIGSCAGVCVAPAGSYCGAGEAPGATGLPCAAGRFGSTPGLTQPTCSGNCTAGYACPAGSTTPTAVTCPPGTYSLAGAGVCTPCVVGKYSSASGLSTPCTSACAAATGYYCGEGATAATGAPCPMGTYASSTGATSCTPCAAGLYGNVEGMGMSSCTGVCTAGRFGSSVGLTSENCTGPCAVGYMCPSGSTVATAVLCPPGTYSASSGAQCTPCPAQTPYSLAGSGSIQACVSQGAANSQDFGKALPGPVCSTGWSAWADAKGVEGHHSCLKYTVWYPASWSGAASQCTGQGAHLLTAGQVWWWGKLGLPCVNLELVV